ncbi:MAG: hypothetical protein SGI77_05825 [Pirellulaceae bacterium]|nr:hypothetical protein [Pirellulaceae bacterium]
MNHGALKARWEVEQVLKQFAEKDRGFDARWKVHSMDEGQQAQLFSAQRENGSDGKAIVDEVVIKLYKQTSAEDRVAYLSEKHNLVVLSGLLDEREFGGWSMRSPTLYYASDNPLALVMSVLPGEPISRWLQSSHNTIAARESAARAILAALRTLWSRDVLYGDLNLKNVLFDPSNRTIGFIDPGLPEAFFSCDQVSRDWYPASRDLAYLLFSVAVNVKSTLRKPAARSRQWSFVKYLLQQYVESIDCSTRQAMLLEEIRSCAQVHCEALDCSWSASGLWRRMVKSITRRCLNTALEELAKPNGQVKR